MKSRMRVPDSSRAAFGPPPTRAPRFALRLPLRYRAVGEGSWREGLTENISRSGVLFRAGDLLQVSTAVELTFALSVADLNSEVFCRGLVVRAVPPAGPSDPPALAATIEDYRFVRGQRHSSETRP